MTKTFRPCCLKIARSRPISQDFLSTVACIRCLLRARFMARSPVASPLEHTPSSMDDLPAELLLQIVMATHDPWRLSALVCKRWRQAMGMVRLLRFRGHTPPNTPFSTSYTPGLTAWTSSTGVSSSDHLVFSQICFASTQGFHVGEIGHCTGLSSCFFRSVF